MSNLPEIIKMKTMDSTGRLETRYLVDDTCRLCFQLLFFSDGVFHKVFIMYLWNITLHRLLKSFTGKASVEYV